MRDGRAKGNQIHSSTLWTLGIPKIYMGPLLIHSSFTLKLQSWAKFSAWKLDVVASIYIFWIPRVQRTLLCIWFPWAPPVLTLVLFKICSENLIFALNNWYWKNLDHFGAGKGNRFLKVSNSTFRTLRVTYKVICRSHHTNCHFMSFIFKGPVSFLSRSIFTSSFCHSSRIPFMNGSFITYFWDCWCMNMMPIFESNFSKVWYLQ